MTDTLTNTLYTAVDHFIYRTTWGLSSHEIHPEAAKERLSLDMHFDHMLIFGEKDGFDGIEWRQHFSQFEGGYERLFDHLIDAHEMFLKLNDNVAHCCDALIPVLSVAPELTHEVKPMPSLREASAPFRNARTSVVQRHNKFIATQYSNLGNSLREFGWEPSLECLTT